MGNLLRYPVKFLFIVQCVSTLLFTWLYWNITPHNTTDRFSFNGISFFKIIDELLKGIAFSLQRWFAFVCFAITLHVLFLIVLKMICRIKFKELFLFVLITLHGLFFISMLLSAVIPDALANYLFAFSLLLISYFLLKFSDHWNYTAEGLPD